jgi:hypothetical protein
MVTPKRAKPKHDRGMNWGQCLGSGFECLDKLFLQQGLDRFGRVSLKVLPFCDGSLGVRLTSLCKIKQGI